MAGRVQLYVYDLSRGMAKAMSLGLTGKQIDGICVVVFGREVFYGRGIMEAHPGTTHHGTPQQIIDVGETHIDAETFQEYLSSVSELYTPSAYHLMDFNCNNFTADVVGFLTGAEIPSWISGLPSEFLATPLGQMLKPQIDAMFGGSNAAEHSAFSPTSRSPAPAVATPTAATPASGTPSQQDLASTLLQAFATQAAGGMGGGAGPSGSAPAHHPPNPETAALSLVTSFANFNSILSNNRAVVVNFTNTSGCPPCRVIKPAYESIAASNAALYGPKGARFIEVELGVGEGQSIASQHGVSATPTFQFFKDGKKVDEMRGADKRGLESRVESFLDDCFPRHPHRRLYLPQTERVSTQPITATATPAYPALLSKLGSFEGATPAHVKVLSTEVVPFLEGKVTLDDTRLRTLVDKWTTSTNALLRTLKPADTFPLNDLWRVGLLNPRVSSALALCLSPSTTRPQPLGPILSLTANTLKTEASATPRPLLLTTLRLATNLLAPLPLANLVLSPGAALQPDLVTVLIEALLHPEVSVRKAAADVAVNAAGWRHRVSKERARLEGESGEDDFGNEADWEVELLSALLEGIGREQDPDVGHRLLAATALIIYLSPGYDATVKPLLEVLDAQATLYGAGKRWGKPDVRKLADEVASKLC